MNYNEEGIKALQEKRYEDAVKAFDGSDRTEPGRSDRLHQLRGMSLRR